MRPENGECRLRVRPVADAVPLQACPDNEWRLIFALRGCGGMGCPSEMLALLWPDIDWRRGRIVIREGEAKQRVIPFFDELRTAWSGRSRKRPRGHLRDHPEPLVGHDSPDAAGADA